MNSATDRRKWGLIRTIHHSVGDLFPTRKTKTAMWGLVALGVAITYLELMAADLFSSLITRIDEQSRTQTTLQMAGFLLAFVGVRGIGYFQSVYRLTVFERALRQLSSASPIASTWRWPMAIDLVGILGQVARLITVIVVVARTQWVFGVLLVLCTGAALLIVDRTGRRQHGIHHQFIAAKRSGSAPSAAERIGTRIRAGERAGLAAVGPVLLYVVALGLAAGRGDITTHAALVLFISGRMAANMYGAMANTTMRFIRAQVNVEAYGATPSPTPQSYAAPDEVARTTASGYLFEPPGQVAARMIDDGQYIGDVETVGRVSRDAGAGPRQGLSKWATTPRPDKIVASASNQVWLHDAFFLPIKDGTAIAHVIVDVFSRSIVGWRTCDEIAAADIRDVFEEACRLQQIDPSDVELHSATALVGDPPSLHDLLKSLGVTRSLLWSGPDDAAARTDHVRPPFPTRFPSRRVAEEWLGRFVPWYNDDFYHPHVGYQRPSVVHAGLADVVTAQRQGKLDDVAAQRGTPIRFPDQWAPPQEAWINRISISTTRRALEDAEIDALDEDEGL